MEYRFLGKTGVRVSKFAFGAMPFGGAVALPEAKQLFDRCMDAGINFYDCADVYNDGRCESIMGELIQGVRDQIVLTSKAYFPNGSGQNDRGSSRYHLVRSVEQSLRRLKTDRIDIFFLHRFDDETCLDETLCTLDDLVRQGKILYPAASNFAAWQVVKAMGRSEAKGWERFACIQPMYNLVKRQAEVEILPMAQAEKLGVVTYSPLGGGLLSGKYSVKNRPEDGRLVANKMYGVRYQDEQLYRVAEAFTALASELGHHPAALAVAWVAHHRGVTAPLIGARNIEQLEVGLAAVDIEMNDELWERIASLSPRPALATDRNEERTDVVYGQR